MAQDPRKETLHFCLSPAFCSAGSAGRDGEWKGMTVNIGGRKYPLKRHSRETLAQAARDNMAIAFLSESAQEKITAYAQIESEAVNRQALSMVMVQEEQEDGRLPVLHHFSYFKRKTEYRRNGKLFGNLCENAVSGRGDGERRKL